MSGLKHRLAQPEILIAPGIFDMISLKVAGSLDFEAHYMTGYGTSASRLGLPDLGYAGLAEMADHARNLAAAVTIPLIADADTGYGNALGVRRNSGTPDCASIASSTLSTVQECTVCSRCTVAATWPW